jgi:hypothetical protein
VTAVPQLGKLFILAGIFLVVVGLLLVFGTGISLGRIGKLPGDIYVKRDNFTFYFPLTTSILLSVLLTLIFSLISRK